MSKFQELSSLIWSVADDVLRGLFKPHEYGDVILPFVILRRLDCVIEPRKDEIYNLYEEFKSKVEDPSLVIRYRIKAEFYNTSKYDLSRLKQDPKNTNINYRLYINGFSKNVYDIIENFQLDKPVEKLHKNNRLFLLVEKFSSVDLHPDVVDNHAMGQIFEELLRKFSEMSNETSGEHYDIKIYGQELNPQTYSICKSDLLISGENPDHIRLGSSLGEDGFTGGKFDYMITNPPFGVSWKSEEEFVTAEAQNPNGRFFAGTPRTSDGSLLFLQHMISKMEEKGSRIGIVFNGSPLFTGDAGSGESEIRRWIIENDWLECIVQLPDSLFFNTGITTYIWILNNSKKAQRKGKIQLINACGLFKPMKKSLGSKRKEICSEQQQLILDTYTGFGETEICKIFPNPFFGYTKVTIEQPLTEDGAVKTDKNGNPKPDSSLRDYERIPLGTNIDEYCGQELGLYLQFESIIVIMYLLNNNLRKISN